MASSNLADTLHGLRRSIHEVPKDGHCIPSAIAACLNIDRNEGHTCPGLLSKLRVEIHKHDDVYRDVYTSTSFEKDVDAYINHKQFDQNIVDMVLTALATMLRLKIIIYKESAKGDVKPETITPIPGIRSTKDILLLRRGGNTAHYDSLVLTQELLVFYKDEILKLQCQNRHLRQKVGDEEVRELPNAQQELDEVTKKTKLKADTEKRHQDKPTSDVKHELELSKNNGDYVTVIISQLELNEDSPPLSNDAVTRLFIEYSLMGVPREETETPFSLPKMGPEKSLSFNFTKVFHVDFEQHYERRQYLASMLLPGDPNEGRICFTVVSEPVDDEDECVDVGVAFASVRDIMNNRRDIEDQKVPVYDMEDKKTEIGSLQITVHCLAALDAIKKEMEHSSANSRDYSQS